MTLRSLQDAIGSMFGVLLQSLVHLPAVLVDFYLFGLLEEGKVDPNLESDDDDWHSFSQVQVVCPPPGCQPIELMRNPVAAALPFYHSPPSLKELNV